VGTALAEGHVALGIDDSLDRFVRVQQGSGPAIYTLWTSDQVNLLSVGFSSQTCAEFARRFEYFADDSFGGIVMQAAIARLRSPVIAISERDPAARGALPAHVGADALENTSGNRRGRGHAHEGGILRPDRARPGRVAATAFAPTRRTPLDVSRLKATPLFEDVPEEELRQIAGFAQEVTVDAGRELVREGDFSYEFMTIEEGEAEVTRDGEHLADLGPGDFFGEMGLLEKTLRNATVTAKTPMKLVTLTGWDLKRMERHIPEAIERVRATLEERRQS
jgi:CRP/FNR family transcriptional regulator, cyclic AMP receptor protein